LTQKREFCIIPEKEQHSFYSVKEIYDFTDESIRTLSVFIIRSIYKDYKK